MTTIAPTPIVAPFTVLVDSAEGDPYTFEGLHADSRQGSRPLVVPTQWACLGRSTSTSESNGDYSIEGYIGRVAIERKSMEDCWSTVLSYGDRRERFESELRNLSLMEAAAVVVESTVPELLDQMPQYGVKTKEQNQKTFFRTVLAWQMDYEVQWIMAGSRRLAEVATYRWLERFYRKQMEVEKQLRKGVA
jgi:hypothetical protein